MRESWKWRSGRERERVGVRRPLSGGGKTPSTLGDEESVASESYRDVVMPALVATALEVVEAEFAFEVLIDALGTPALFDEPDERFTAGTPRQGGEMKMLGGGLPISPFAYQPQRFSFIRFPTIVMVWDDATKGEAGG